MKKLVIGRYEYKGNTIHSIINYTDKNNYFNCVGIEKKGLEIPFGTYKASYSISPKFGYGCYLIDVPHRQGIRIHIGNSSKDTTGCLIIALFRHKEYIVNSEEALSCLHAVSKQQELIIEVKCLKKQLTKF